MDQSARLKGTDLLADAQELKRRIEERFGNSKILVWVNSLVNLTGRMPGEVRRLSRPRWGFRIFAFLAVLGVIGIVPAALYLIKPEMAVPPIFDFFQGTGAFFDIVFVIGVASFWIFAHERRSKMRAWREIFSELRNFALQIQRLQRPMDADRLNRAQDQNTKTSPKLPDGVDSAFKMGRYLDYCSEMFQHVALLAAYAGQSSVSEDISSLVADIEALTSRQQLAVSAKVTILAREGK